MKKIHSVLDPCDVHALQMADATFARLLQDVYRSSSALQVAANDPGNELTRCRAEKEYTTAKVAMEKFFRTLE